MSGRTGRLMTLCLHCVQGGRCFYCGSEFFGQSRNHKKPDNTQWTRDHVQPRSKGNQIPGNTVLACCLCNAKKANRDPTEQEVKDAKAVYSAAKKLLVSFLGDSNLQRLHEES